MQIAVTYKDGVLVPKKPLKLRRDQLVVTIPDELLKNASPVLPTKSVNTSMRERINQILGAHAHSRSTVDTDADKAVWQQHLSDKYLTND